MPTSDGRRDEPAAGRRHDGRRHARRGRTKDDASKKLLPVTPFGRYVKILLSSNEFLFVN